MDTIDTVDTSTQEDPRYRAFAIAYVSNGYNAKSAAVLTGWERDQGRNLTYHPVVIKHIHLILDALQSRSTITSHYIHNQLDRLQEIAMGEIDVPMVTAAGETYNAPKFMERLALEVLRERIKLEHESRPPEEAVEVAQIRIQIIEPSQRQPSDEGSYDEDEDEDDDDNPY